MGSLTAHLTESELHGRLPFHPDCPICRQTRLAGTLQTGGLLPARVPASLAAGLMAASLIVPGPALAGEQEQEHEGTAPPSQTGATESSNDPDFDPGGNSTELPSAPPEPAQPPPTAQPEPPSPAPAASASGEEDDPVVDNGDGSDPNAAPAQPAPTTPVPTPAPASPPSSSTPPPATAPASPTPEQPPAVVGPPAAQPPSSTKQTASSGHARARARQHGNARPRQQVVHRQQPPAVAPAPAPPATPVPATTHAVPVASATAGTAARARPGDRTHAVQPGESLWAIASDLLGRDARPARIAREVHRLWELNKERIATGDPDLVMIGTRLVLR